MNSQPTYEEIASNFELWGERCDPDATMTKEAFDSLTVEQKIDMQIEMFGEEEEVADTEAN